MWKTFRRIKPEQRRLVQQYDSIREIAASVSVTERRVYKLLKLRNETGNHAPRPDGRARKRNWMIDIDVMPVELLELQTANTSMLLAVYSQLLQEIIPYLF